MDKLPLCFANQSEAVLGKLCICLESTKLTTKELEIVEPFVSGIHCSAFAIHLVVHQCLSPSVLLQNIPVPAISPSSCNSCIVESLCLRDAHGLLYSLACSLKDNGSSFSELLKFKVRSILACADRLLLILGCNSSVVAQKKLTEVDSSSQYLECVPMTNVHIPEVIRCFSATFPYSDSIAHSLEIMPEEAHEFAEAVVPHFVKQGLSWLVKEGPKVVGIILVEEAHTSSLSTIPYPKDSPISPIFEFYAQLMQTALEGRVQDKTFCHVAFHGVEQSGIAHSKVNLALALRYYANSSARRKGYMGRTYRDLATSSSPVEYLVKNVTVDPSTFVRDGHQPFASLGLSSVSTYATSYTPQDDIDDMFEQCCIFTALHTSLLAIHPCSRLCTLLLFGLFRQAISSQGDSNGSTSVKSSPQRESSKKGSRTVQEVSEMKEAICQHLESTGMDPRAAKEGYVMLVTMAVPLWQQILNHHRRFSLSRPERKPSRMSYSND